jgi:hypothetical protein
MVTDLNHNNSILKFLDLNDIIYSLLLLRIV